jgi:hypothetical protein
MIVGKVGLADLAPILRSLRKTVAREVNPVVFSISEFKDKLNSGEHFLTAVAASQKIFLIGAQSDLAKTLNREQNKIRGR